jgi:hypothetical protein
MVMEWGGEQVMLCPAEGPLIDSDRAAVDLVGDAMGEGASLVALPVSRLAPAFFDLRSGLAGAVAQKIVNYQLRLAVIGDISSHLTASNALRDWVREANRQRAIWFVQDLDELAERLGHAVAPETAG